MNSDRCHNEAQFQWLRYQLDSHVKLFPTLVAKWLECWKCVVWVAGLRGFVTTCMFIQILESIHGWIAVCTDEWCYMYILLCTNLNWQPDKRGRVFGLPPTLWPDPNRNCFIAESHPLVNKTEIVTKLKNSNVNYKPWLDAKALCRSNK